MKNTYAVAIVQRCNIYTPKLPILGQKLTSEAQQIVAQDPIAASSLIFVDAVSEDEARGRAITLVDRRIGDIASAFVKQVPEITDGEREELKKLRLDHERVISDLLAANRELRKVKKELFGLKKAHGPQDLPSQTGGVSVRTNAVSAKTE